MILFTVPDSAIAEVWQQAKPYVSGKVIGHYSGLYSSDIFSDWDSMNCHACSITSSCCNQQQRKCMENYPAYCSHSRGLLLCEGSGDIFPFHGQSHPYHFQRDKIKYHAAAAISSNYMTALLSMSSSCFSTADSHRRKREARLYALQGNLDHILTQGCVQSLTGPLEKWLLLP